jgi:hypothetical protein
MTDQTDPAPDASVQRKAFFDGASYWEEYNAGATLWPSDKHKIMAEAIKRYPVLGAEPNLVAGRTGDANSPTGATQPRPVDDAGALETLRWLNVLYDSFDNGNDLARRTFKDYCENFILRSRDILRAALSSKQDKIRRMQKLIEAQREEIAAHDDKDAIIESHAAFADEAKNWRKELVDKDAVIERMRAAIELSIKRIGYLGVFAGERHAEANEKEFIPLLKEALREGEE